MLNISLLENKLTILFATIFSCLVAIFYSLYPNIAYGAEKDWTIQDYKNHYAEVQRSPELVQIIENEIENLPKGTEQKTEIDLYLWKLVVLASLQESGTKIESGITAAQVASEIFQRYDRDVFESERHYGKTMYQIVESLSKTDELDVSYDIIRRLRESVYQNPSNYLSYTIDRSLVEVYIETYDYQKALDISLSILENDKYHDIKGIKNSTTSLLNEVAYLYTRLGDGENALVYLDRAEASFSPNNNLTDKRRLKARTRNRGNRARAYILLEEYEKADELAKEALTGAKKLDENYMLALGYRLTGSTAYHLGRYEEAKANLENGIKLVEENNISAMKRTIFDDYSKLLEKIGDHEQALIWQRRLYELEVDVTNVLITTRSRLNDVEVEALISHQEVEKLRKENEAQRKTAKQDDHVKNLLLVTIASLLAGAAILTSLLMYMRKAQQKLRVSEKKAQIANRAKSDFLATMSHEIRTPMNGVLGMAQILNTTPLSNDQKSYVDIMTRSGEHLLNIINDILDFSKLEADKLPLDIEEHDLDLGLRDILTLFKARADEKSIELQYRYDENLPKHFSYDSGRLSQVLTNLIGNAIKFTENGIVALHIQGTAGEDRSKHNLEIRITDTGVGISKEKLNIIFDKFTQAESSTTRKFGGTGLGLAISRKIVEAMDGRLSVTSKLGEGSSFLIEVPFDVSSDKLKQTHNIGLEPSKMSAAIVSEKPQLSEAEVQDDKSQKTTSHEPALLDKPYPDASGLPVVGTTAPIGTSKTPVLSQTRTSSPKASGGINILLVEDNEINATVVKTMLEHPRIHITVVENGEDAILAFAKNRYNLILMDISMPVMDGVTATKLIRQKEALENRKRTPIICMTAHVMEKEQEFFMRAGMDGYLSKPVDNKALLKTLKVWLKPQGSKAA